jgi:digeranylgeranylglycerophospholipid reductase
LPHPFYDVIVVGAGPAGSYAAYELASSGYSVAVLEQKSVPGLDVCCTGIVSRECFDSFGISPEVILAKANSAKLFSPSRKCLRLQTERVQAYVLNRDLFDKAVASKAQAQGADYFFGCRVTNINIGKDGAGVEAHRCDESREMLTARAVLLASGLTPGLSQKLGLGKISGFLVGAQTELETENIAEVEVYFDQQIAPGCFAWLVPIAPNRALIGLLSTSQAKLHLEKFLLSASCRGRILNRRPKIRQKAIPLGILPRTYEDRMLVIGDAAGQVKPTTGGGIYFGHIGTKIAVRVLNEALTEDNLAANRLSRYQKEWKAKLGKEIRFGCWARQVFTRLSNNHIDYLFHLADKRGVPEAIATSKNFSFDWHNWLLLQIASCLVPFIKALEPRGRSEPEQPNWEFQGE